MRDFFSKPYLGKLSPPDERFEKLKELILKMRWDDGGWNCDRKPKARKSSLVTTCIAVRGLNQYRRVINDDSVDLAINSGLQYLLDHQLCQSRNEGNILHPDMVKFFYPEYYHYNILYALRVFVEAEFPYSEKMAFPLDYIERSRQGFGWSADKKYYWRAKKDRAGKSLVNWGTLKQNKINYFVTMYAIHVLLYYRKYGL